MQPITPTTSKQVSTPTPPFPHPAMTADSKLIARNHLLLGSYYYGRQQWYRALATLTTIGLSFVVAMVSLTLDDKNKLWILALAVIATFLVSIVVQFVVLKFLLLHDQKKAAESFESAEEILFHNGTPSQPSTTLNELLKSLHSSKTDTDNWFVSLKTLIIPEAKFLAAALQESKFREREHFRSMLIALVLAMSIFTIGVSVIYASIDNRPSQLLWLAAFLPLLAPILECAHRNYEGFRDFSQIKSSGYWINKFFLKQQNKQTLIDEGIALMKEIVVARRRHGPVCKSAYKWWRNGLNEGLCVDIAKGVATRGGIAKEPSYFP